MAQGFTGAGISGSGAANRVAFWSATSVLSSDSAFTYNSGSQVLTVPNLVVTTAATFSARTATRIAYFGVAGVLSDAAGLTFDGINLLGIGSAFLGGASGTLVINVTAGKILALNATDNYTLIVPATGTAALLGVANVFTANQTISNTAPSLILTDTTAAAKSLTIAVDANLADLRESAGAQGSLLVLDLANNRVGIGANPTVALDVTGAAKISTTITVGSSVITGTSGNLTVNVTAAKTLTLSAADNYTLTVPATGTAALLNIANVFTANQTISNTAPSLTLNDTTASAKSALLITDTNTFQIYESAGASGSLLALDLANNRVGIGIAAPVAPLQVSPAANSEAVRAGSFGGLSVINGGYLVFTQNAYSFGNTTDFKNTIGSTGVGMAVISPMRTTGSTTIGGVFVHAGQASVDTTVAWSTFTTALAWDVNGNVGINSVAWGTSAASVLSVGTGTAPSSGPADTVQFYSSDDSAGNTVPSFYCEGTGVVATGQADSASSVRVKMRINGTVRTFLCI